MNNNDRMNNSLETIFIQFHKIFLPPNLCLIQTRKMKRIKTLKISSVFLSQKFSIIDFTRISYSSPQKELLLMEWPQIINQLEKSIPITPFTEVSDSDRFRSKFILGGHGRIVGNVAIKCNNKTLWIPAIFDTGSPEIFLSAETFNKFGFNVDEGFISTIEIGKWNGIAALSEGKSIESSPLKNVNIIGMSFLGKKLVRVFESHFDEVTGSMRKEFPDKIDDFLRDLFPIYDEESLFIQEIVLNSFRRSSGNQLKKITNSRGEMREILKESKEILLKLTEDQRLWNLINKINLSLIMTQISEAIEEFN